MTGRRLTPRQRRWLESARDGYARVGWRNAPMVRGLIHRREPLVYTDNGRDFELTDAGRAALAPSDAGAAVGAQAGAPATKGQKR